jgi:hypothetical protein
VQLQDSERSLPEAVAVQRLQDALAAMARLTPDELAKIWRAAMAKLEDHRRANRPRHTHGTRRKS